MLRLVTSTPRSSPSVSLTIPLPEHRRLGAPSRLPTMDLPEPPVARPGLWASALRWLRRR